MASVSTYLNFERDTEAAFNFYKSVFSGEFGGNGIMRMGDVPPQEGMPPIPEADKKLVMHVDLTILGGHHLLGSDAPSSMGHKVTKGNNVHITLAPDTRKETERLFKALSAGGKVTMELQDMFWGDYYGTCIDKFGISWMFNCSEKK